MEAAAARFYNMASDSDDVNLDQRLAGLGADSGYEEEEDYGDFDTETSTLVQRNATKHRNQHGKLRPRRLALKQREALRKSRAADYARDVGHIASGNVEDGDSHGNVDTLEDDEGEEQSRWAEHLEQQSPNDADDNTSHNQSSNEDGADENELRHNASDSTQLAAPSDSGSEYALVTCYEV